MKKLLMIATIAVILVSCAKENVGSGSSSTTASTSSSASEDRVGTPPPAVAAAFVATFGNVPVQQWKLRSDGTWRAHFTRNGVAWEATFTASGTLIKSEAAK
jgi:hypothetical protein